MKINITVSFVWKNFLQRNNQNYNQTVTQIMIAITEIGIENELLQHRQNRIC